MNYDKYLQKEYQVFHRKDEILKDLGVLKIPRSDSLGGCPDFQKTLNKEHNFNKYLKELRERYA